MEERERASKKWGERESRQAGGKRDSVVCVCVWVIEYSRKRVVSSKATATQAKRAEVSGVC